MDEIRGQNPPWRPTHLFTFRDGRGPMAHENVTLRLTARQAEALRGLAAAEELPPEVYAAEVLVKHLYHAWTPEAAARAAGGRTPPQD